MDVTYLEKIDGNVAEIHREFEKESRRKLPRLERRRIKHMKRLKVNTHTFCNIPHTVTNLL